MNVYVKNSETPFDLSLLEGNGYNIGANLGVFSVNHGMGINWMGIPTTSQYASYGIGIGPGVGFYGGPSVTQYLMHY